MSDKKQTTKQTGSTTSTYGYQPGASSPDIDAYRDADFDIDPSIGHRLGEKERQLKDSFVSPTGGYVTPQIKDAILRSGQRNLMQDASQATREGQFDVNKLKLAQKAGVAGMTAPVLTQTSGTSSGTGTVSQSENPLGTVAKVAGAVAPISL